MKNLTLKKTMPKTVLAELKEHLGNIEYAEILCFTSRTETSEREIYGSYIMHTPTISTVEVKLNDKYNTTLTLTINHKKL